MKSGFLKRLLERAEKIDKKQMLDFMQQIVHERDLFVKIFNHAKQGMIVMSDDGRVEYINEAARCILNLSEGMVTTDAPLPEVVDQPSILRFYKTFLESSEPQISERLTIRIPEGERHLILQAQSLFQSSDHVGCLIQLTDESERRQREEKLREAEKLAALATLTAGMSHEIRNPLNSMSIHLQLLQRELKKKGVDDENTQNVLDLFASEIKRLNSVIESFLSAARPSQPRKQLLSLYTLITDTLTLMQPEFTENGIQVSLHEEGEWPYIEGDPGQMKQAFINILRNAIEAVKSCSDDLRSSRLDEVVISMSNDDNERVSLKFSDTGIGIKEKDIRKIFEPYFTTKAEGTGLGLMIVDRIIREMGGTLHARSEPGKGTHIIMRLPVAADKIKLLNHGKGSPDES